MTNTDEYAPILVEGNKDPFTLSPKRLRAAVVTFRKDQPRYAPAAPLAFEIVSRGASLDGVKLRIDDGGDERFDLPLNADGLFTLPAVDLAGKNWWITGNRKARTMFVRSIIRSPGLPANTHRIGDQRLQCRVSWSLLKDTIEPEARIFADLFGGACGFTKLGVFIGVPRPLDRAIIKDGSREIAVPLGKDGKSFKALYHDKSISNDALLLLTYKPNS